MMKLNLDDAGRSVFGLEVLPSEDGSYFHHSGPLLQALRASAFDEDYRCWVCVAVRDGSVTVTISDGEEIPTVVVYTVWPGSPLVVLSPAAVGSVLVEQVGNEVANVEALIFPSEFLAEGDEAEAEFLVLNAGEGVTEAGGGVTAWRDVRPESGAPENFVPYGSLAGHGPTLIESDPDFNDRASVEWTTQNASLLRYSLSDASTVNLWDFLGSDGEFLLLAIIKPNADRGVQTNFMQPTGAGAGTELMVDGGYRIRYRSYGGNPTPEEQAEYTATQEIIEDGAMVIALVQDVQLGIRLYRQGVWQTLGVHPQVESPATFEQLIIGCFNVGDNIELGLKIADFRLWNFLPQDWGEKVEQYVAMAEADYGVNSSVRQGHPWVTGATAMYRANRGVSSLSDITFDWRTDTVLAEPNVNGWSDTRPEAVWPILSADIVDYRECPGRGTLRGEPAIRSYGGAPSDSLGQNLFHEQTPPGSGVISPFDTPTWTIAMVLQPEAVSAVLRGGVVLRVGNGATGSIQQDSVIVAITNDGELRFIAADDTEAEVVDEVMDIGSAFDQPFALLMRFNATSGVLTMHAANLETGEAGTAGYAFDTAWAVWTAMDHPWVRLFDYESYYTPYQAFEGMLAEFTVVPEFVSGTKIDQFLAYATRRYGG